MRRRVGRRWLPVRLLAGCVLSCCVLFGSLAQAAYPDRPVRALVGFVAGGSTDVIARILQPKMAEALGQPLVIENRPGSGGTVAAAALARAEPDGHAIMFGSPGQLAVNPYLLPSVAYDPAVDFRPVSQVTSNMLNLVVPADSPFDTLEGLLDAAASDPNGLAYGSAGYGSSMHVGGAMLDVMTDANLLHVPYRGSAAASLDLLPGRLDFMIDTQATTRSHIESGRLRLLAVTGEERHPEYPAVPTVGELVPGYMLTSWLGLVVPAGTPDRVVDRLYEALREAVRDPEVRARAAAVGSVLWVRGPKAFARHLASERDRARRVVREAGIGVSLNGE